MQYWSYVVPIIHNRYADPTGPLSAWLTAMEGEWDRLIREGVKPADISVFGVPCRDGIGIDCTRFPSADSLRSMLTTFVWDIFADPNLRLTFHSFRHCFYARA